MKWSAIRAFGNVKYFNVCYIVLFGVPFLAEAYIATNKAGKYPEFPHSLKWLYLASICYAIAIVLYQYFCPQIIKVYERDKDYRDAEIDIHLKARPDRQLEIILANLGEGQDDLRKRIQHLQMETGGEKKQELSAFIDTYYESSVQRFLLLQFAREDKRNPVLTKICALFYFSGTAIMLWLLIDKSIKVLKA